MKHIHFDTESDGYYGAYWECRGGSDCTVIAMLGDDPEDHMAHSPRCKRIDHVAGKKGL